MYEVLNTPFFGIVMTIVAYETGVFCSRKFKLAICNPMLIASILLIGFLLLTGVSLETYNIGGDYISIFLAPATAVLAVPLYKQLDNLKKNIIPIVIGIFTGCIVSFALVSLCVFIFEIDVVLHYSLLPKSITIPMGMELSRIIGGIPSITIASIVITGITGGVVAPIVCKVCKIKHPVAQGIAIGTSAHAIGTAKALEMGEVQGAMSSLAIGVCGVFTTILTPILLHFWAH
ncbi:MAG: LrgB family protein [Hallerella porci]|uniref:Murein hydrolase (TIGR00659 family) n=1 Tax=Hallerella porci TaxID=1945871 RepID=A0ABX5LPW2_9BACT|nr:LrgB family protein [Hallerella porci]MDY3920554.1 LrgB family protein [Hallerella porci]PWL01920.1 putative murein hydrolase (TIGR00659 family) [Hallerella porci]